MNITLEDVTRYMEAYRAYQDRAEQHEFAFLFMLDMKIVPAYNDLVRNWDENHARIFINIMVKVLNRLGVPIPDKCGHCKAFLGMGDWSLCCSKKPDLCYEDTAACKEFEIKEDTQQ